MFCGLWVWCVKIMKFISLIALFGSGLVGTAYAMNPEESSEGIIRRAEDCIAENFDLMAAVIIESDTFLVVVECEQAIEAAEALTRLTRLTGDEQTRISALREKATTNLASVLLKLRVARILFVKETVERVLDRLDGNQLSERVNAYVANAVDRVRSQPHAELIASELNRWVANVWKVVSDSDQPAGTFEEVERCLVRGELIFARRAARAFHLGDVQNAASQGFLACANELTALARHVAARRDDGEVQKLSQLWNRFTSSRMNKGRSLLNAHIAFEKGQAFMGPAFFYLQGASERVRDLVQPIRQLPDLDWAFARELDRWVNNPFTVRP